MRPWSPQFCRLLEDPESHRESMIWTFWTELKVATPSHPRLEDEQEELLWSSETSAE